MPYNYPGLTPGSPFGASRPNEKFGFHGGSDYIAAPGTPVPALYGGRVYRSGYINGYGMAVIIETESSKGPVYSLYAHLGPDALPKVGTQVSSGDPIGNVGSLEFNRSVGAKVTGPHLHLEIIHGGPEGVIPHQAGSLYAPVTLPPPGSFFPPLIGGVPMPAWPSPGQESEDDDEED